MRKSARRARKCERNSCAWQGRRHEGLPLLADAGSARARPQVEAGKGEWCSLARASNEAALWFPVDEGYRARPEGGWKRKARRPSGRRARVRDGGLCAR